MLAAAPFTAIDIVTEGVEVSASGDIAWAYGTYTSTNTVSGEPYEDTGKWLNGSETRDGRWLMVVDTWNSDTPMTGMEAPATEDTATP
jgi:ketosteroid isomerase-like protein